MKLNQMTVKYDPEEDRLLIRMNTNTEEEFQYYMTRRIAKQMLPLMNKYFDREQANISSNVSNEAKKEIKQFQHQKMLEDVKFSNEYKEVSGDSEKKRPPILVSKITLKQLENDKIQMGLFPKDQEGIQFGTNLKFLHSFYQLMVNSIKRAEWDLVLKGSVEVVEQIEPIETVDNNSRKH